MELEELLRTGALYLKLLRSGRYADVELHVNYYNQNLELFLRTLKLAALDTGRQTLLRQLAGNHMAIIDCLTEQKLHIREQLMQLQRGQRLQQSYIKT